MKGITQQDCTQKIFDTAIRLNRNKILGRLSSQHFSRPAYIHTATNSPPSQQLVNIAQRLTGPKQKAELIEHLDAFRSEVRMPHESFRELEHSIEGARLQSIDKTVKAAFRLTRDGVSLARSIEEIGLQRLHSRLERYPRDQQSV